AFLSSGAHLKWRFSTVEQDRGAVKYRVQPGGPFVVQTPFGSVQVVGTLFDVRVGAPEPGDQSMKAKKSTIAATGAALGALLFVTVYEGKVRLSHGDRELVLAQGDAAAIGADGIPERVASPAAVLGSAGTSSAARSADVAPRRLSPEQQQLRRRVIDALQ